MPEDDPYTQIHKALYGLMTSWTPFTSKVRAGNRITFTGTDADPVKEMVAPADLPEVRLVSTGGSCSIQRTSNTSTVKRRWEIQIATGDLRVDVDLFPLEWEITRALSRWQSTLASLTWHSKAFVLTCLPGEFTNGRSQADLERGIRGWAAIWACEAELKFPTVDIQNPAV